MAQKQSIYKVKGMQKDNAMSNFNSEFAYEIKNMRLVANEELTGLSLVNEKGPAYFYEIPDIETILNVCSCKLGFIIFAIRSTTAHLYDTYPNGIYLYKPDEEYKTLALGDFNFNESYPIESIYNYEADDIQKVYWIDGLNPLRSININKFLTLQEDEIYQQSDVFNVIKKLTIDYSGLVDAKLGINLPQFCNIERIPGGGFFAPGVIQYSITAFNQYETESPILYTTPLLNVSREGRGLKPDEFSSEAFKVSVVTANLDSDFQYLRIYRIHRTSLNGTPDVQIIQERAIPKQDDSRYIEIIDEGIIGTSIPAADLFFKEANSIIAQSIAAKDNTLFLGNYKVTSKYSKVTVNENFLNEGIVNTDSKKNISGYEYSKYRDTYYNNLTRINNTTSTTHYKYLETYRFGIQLQDTFGNWTDPIWVGDYKITAAPSISSKDELLLSAPSIELNEDLLNNLVLEYNDTTVTGLDLLNYFTAIRPVVVFPNINERSIIAQGVVCPTVYNLKDRKDNSPHAQASWFMRPNAPIDLWNLPYNGKSFINQEDAAQVINHPSDVIYPDSIQGYNIWNNTAITSDHCSPETTIEWKNTKMSLVYDDVSLVELFDTNIKDASIPTGEFSTDVLSGYMANDSKYKEYFSGYSGQAGIRGATNLDGTTTNGTILVPKLVFDNPKLFYRNPYPNFRATQFDSIAKDIVTSGSWLEFRHNYALRTKGWTWGPTNDWHDWNFGIEDDQEWATELYPYYKAGEANTSGNKLKILVSTASPSFNFDSREDSNGLVLVSSDVNGQNEDKAYFYKFRMGSARCAELDTSRFGATIPINRFIDINDNNEIDKTVWRAANINTYNRGNSAYYVDSSIVTLNSPELEMSDDLYNMPLHDAKFRIIGMIPLTGTTSDISLQTKGGIYNPSINTVAPFGLVKTLVRNKNIGHHGFKGLVGHASFYSGHRPLPYAYRFSEGGTNASIQESSSQYVNNYAAAFSLHPWQSTGIIPGFPDTWEDKNSYSSLDSKILSNLRFSANTYYFEDTSKIWTPSEEEVVDIFNSDVSNMNKLSLEGYDEDIIYYGDIDSIALASTGDDNAIPIDIYTYFYGRKLHPSSSTDSDGYTPYAGGACYGDVYKKGIGSSIKYKSSPHFIIGFNAKPVQVITHENNIVDKYRQVILPYISPYNKDNVWSTSSEDSIIPLQIAGEVYESNNMIALPYQDSIEFTDETTFGLLAEDNPSRVDIEKDGDISIYSPNYGWLWLGEIYREKTPTFGGTTKYAIRNNIWQIAGEPINLTTDNSTLYWTIGDTYYSRFDTLKTYAANKDAENSIIDITSFMVETRVNADARTDRNRGEESILTVSPENFNLTNEVYNQSDNFYTYRVLEEDLAKRTIFNSQITWTLPKIAGSNTDNWTNISLASTLDLDGTKGPINALKTIDNNIIAFQDSGIANILYNSRVQIPTSEAVPIQIANSGKVDGSIYISDKVGCQNKWSIVGGLNGYYFIDNNTQTIYKIAKSLENMSDTLGFRSWCQKNIANNKWNPTATDAIKATYDIKNKDVLFITDKWCLAYSEMTNAFSSFYDYTGSNLYLANQDDNNLWFTTSKDENDEMRLYIYKHQEGDYNNFFGKYCPYYISIIANENNFYDKTFNTIEFRADTYTVNEDLDSQTTFDNLDISNEYQHGNSDLLYKRFGYSNLKRKFRIWRAEIPRDELNRRDRIRNTWSKITLSKNKELDTTGKTILHDIIVQYSM